MHGLKFRLANIEDYNILTDLWRAAGLPFKPEGRDSKEELTKEFERGIAHFLLAEIEGTPVGSVLITHDGRKGWINRLAIIPEFRKQGISKKLVAEAERILEELGIGIYACLIEDYNKESLEVFQKLGYKDFEGMHYLTKRKYPDI